MKFDFYVDWYLLANIWLLSLGKEELEDIIEKDGKAHTICHFCGEEYDFNKEELEELAKQAK